MEVWEDPGVQQTSTRAVLAMLDELAALTILEEESPQSFKVRAYENAIHGIEGAGVDVTRMSVAELTSIKGVGKSIAEKIREFVETGSVRKLEELRSAYPPAFTELTRIPGLGPKTLKLIRRELGIEDLDGLRAAIETQQLRALPGLGATSEEKIGRAIERLGLHGKERRTPIAVALPLAEQLARELEALEGVERAVYCGSLRRMAETIGDIDVTVAGGVPHEVMQFVVDHPTCEEVVVKGEAKTSILTRAGMQVDVRVVTPAQAGAAILYFTGSKSHNIALRQRAMERGWLLNEYGLFAQESEELVAARTEEDVYGALGLQFIPPPMREGSGEIEAAARGEIDVVERTDILGDLHFHTDQSGDGRSTLGEMLAAAEAAGLHYVAITEHGEDLVINGSSREEMLRHRERIREAASGRPLAVLFGCELNIGPDGGVDYDPEFRREFEWCVASVHSHFDLPQARQTERLLAAIADPTVDAIGHLTGRYIGRRPGIELDVDAVLDALADSGVGLEVNGALDRLDAPSEVIRKAVERGVRLVISTDSHHVSDLRRLDYGVRHAQRGWAPASSVANALPVDDFLEWARSHRG